MTLLAVLSVLLLTVLLLAGVAHLVTVVRMDGLGMRPPPAGRHPYFPQSGLR